MRSPHCVVALDAGIGGGRSVVCDTSGRILSMACREWTYHSTPSVPASYEFDAEQFWADLCTTTRDALKRGDIPADAVRAVSATGQREGIVLVGADGRELYAGPALDARGSEENRALARAYGDRIYHITGHRLNMLHAPGRLLWLQRHRPDILAATRHLLTIDAWLCYRLSGEAAAEPSSACSSLLFDLRRRVWSVDICGLLELDADILPKVAAAGRVIGGLTRAAAAGLGLRPGTPVVLGGGDAQCGLIGLGAVVPGDAAAIAGTTTPMLLTIDQPCLDEQGRTWTRCHSIPGLWAVEANAGITGLRYRWLRDLLWPYPERPDLPSGAYEAMDSAAAAVPPGAHGLRVYLGAYPMDGRRHHFMPAEGAIVGVPTGQSAASTRAAIARAALESAAFAMRYNWDLMQAVTGLCPSTLYVGGGQARSALWCRIVADVLGIPLMVGAASDVTARGAALCALAGVGEANDLAGASRELARHTPVVPHPADHERYAEAYRRWLADLPGRHDTL